MSVAGRDPFGWRRLAAVTTLTALIAACGAPAGSGAAGPAVPGASGSVPPTSSAKPGPSPTGGTTASSASPQPGPSTTLGPGSEIEDGSIAAVTVEGLNLRKGPKTSTAIVKLLTRDTRLFIIEEPQLEGELRWHHVALVPEEGCSETCRAMGWVATPATGADAWIRTAPVACPDSPVEAEDLAKLLPLERLHCYGDRELTVTGWIDTPCCSGVGPLDYSPDWLLEADQFFRLRDDDTGVLVVGFPPQSDARLPATTVVMRATAHFDDPASSTCSARIADDVAPDEVDGVEIPSRDEMVLECRTQLVITAYEVVGYLPGPGCGCLPPSPEPAA